MHTIDGVVQIINIHLKVLEAGGGNIKVPVDLVSDEDPFLACWKATFLLCHYREKREIASFAFFTKLLILFIRALFS